MGYFRTPGNHTLTRWHRHALCIRFVHTQLVHTTPPHSHAAHPPTLPLMDTLSISSLSSEELISSPAASVKDGLPTCARRAPSSLIPACDERRESAGWAGAPCRSGSRMFPGRTHLCLSLVFLSQTKPRLRLGDLIEISRFGYKHWAIYVGGGYVVHLALAGKDGPLFKHEG